MGIVRSKVILAQPHYQERRVSFGGFPDHAFEYVHAFLSFVEQHLVTTTGDANLAILL